MALLLISLISIYVRLGTGKPAVRNSEKILVNIPFSVYLGWITVATIANVTAFLVQVNWNKFGISDQLWTVIVIAVGVIITLATVFSRNDIFYCFVVIWALVGILLKRMADNSMPDQLVIIASIVGISIVGLGIIVQLIRKKKIY
jgi:steroid 5-alpha reductase family enzyme